MKYHSALSHVGMRCLSGLGVGVDGLIVAVRVAVCVLVCVWPLVEWLGRSRLVSLQRPRCAEADQQR